jgi:hypothetical protein
VSRRADSARLPDRWLHVVMASRQLSCCVKSQAAVLWGLMDDDGGVTVVRDDLAALVARGTTVVGDRNRRLVETGFLTREESGRKGRHAIYRATFPTVSERFSDRPQTPVAMGDVQRPENPVAKSAEMAFSDRPKGRSQFLGLSTPMETRQAYAPVARSEPLAARPVRLDGPISASLPLFIRPTADIPEYRASAAEARADEYPRGPRSL